MDPKDSKSRKLYQQMLASLSETQYKMVMYKVKTLQIIAGPGSGKTRVLTSRIAYFVIERCIPPKKIIVVTLTSKAANEMKNRLKYLIGAERSNALFIGTFPSLCCRILRKHASHVDLEPNFVVGDVATSKYILNKLLKDHEIRISDFTGKEMTISEIWGLISKAKHRGDTSFIYSGLYGEDLRTKDIALLYNCYEVELKKLNLVDIDNLVIKTCELLRKKKDVLSNIKAIFVDEFQDTNVAQYDLVKLMTRQGKNVNVTVVGDPDQSINRNAVLLNFNKMEKDFSDMKMFCLEENYRYTGTLLKAAHHVISQDSSRFNKSQQTNNPEGLPIFLISTENEEAQAEFVAQEIQNVVNQSMGLISYKDIAVLMRTDFNSFEQFFRRYKIPFTKFGEDRFFDRAEVQDILSYLKFAYNPKDSLSFLRIINVPKRLISATVLKKLIDQNAKDETDLLETISKSNNLFGFRTYNIFCQFSRICSTLKGMMTRQESVAEMIHYLTAAVHYRDYLKFNYSCYADHEEQWNNIGELISLAQKIHFTSSNEGAHSSNDKENVSLQPIDLSITDDLPKTSNIIEFLDYCALCSNQKEMEEAEGGKVALGTLHSAKGLELPCVFIVTCNEGQIPHVRAVTSNEVEAECRLLYVAITRCRFLLYCVTSVERDYDSTVYLRECTFLNGMDRSIYSLKTPEWSVKIQRMLSQIIRKY